VLPAKVESAHTNLHVLYRSEERLHDPQIRRGTCGVR